jgi:L-iditol 2-dehydrogenase
MRSLRLFAPGDLRLVDEPQPTPAADETLLRVTAVGVCGSDLHWLEDAGIGAARLTRPLVLGHEIAAVTLDGLAVAVDPAIPCGECRYCREGNPNLCLRLPFAGSEQTDGGLRQYMTWPSRCLFPLPAGFSSAAGAMLEPLGVALHAVNLGKVQPGMRVGVFGCGPIGLLVIQAARAAGAAEILVTEPLDHRLTAARDMGAHPWQPGQEVDAAIECAGENAAVEDAIAAARPGGRVILVGIPADDRASFSASIARRKGLTIQLCRRMKHTYPRAVELVAGGQVDVLSLISHRFPLQRAVEAFDAANRRLGLKVIVEP